MAWYYNMPYTHWGTISALGVSVTHKFKETKMYWVSDAGIKFSKDTGCPAGDKSGLVRLDPDTLKRIKK